MSVTTLLPPLLETQHGGGAFPSDPPTSRALHGFVNPRRYPTLGCMGTGMCKGTLQPSSVSLPRLPFPLPLATHLCQLFRGLLN